VSIALTKHLKKNYLAASRQRSEPDWGHSAELAHAYTTAQHIIEQTEGIKRIAKARGIANIPRTQYVRVCYRNVKGLANCGTCKKCVRTRLEFDLLKTPKRPLGLETRPNIKELLETQINKADYKFYLDAIKYGRAKGSKNTAAPLLAVSYARLRSKAQSQIAKLTKKKDPIQGNPRI
jgi:hypothetical protein